MSKLEELKRCLESVLADDGRPELKAAKLLEQALGLTRELIAEAERAELQALRERRLPNLQVPHLKKDASQLQKLLMDFEVFCECSLPDPNYLSGTSEKRLDKWTLLGRVVSEAIGDLIAEAHFAELQALRERRKGEKA